MLSRALLLSVMAAGALQAQVPSRVVTGIVFDSVAGAPLVGAVVQAVLIDSARGSSMRAYSAVTDGAGRYRISDLPMGRFAIAFQHKAVDVFDVELPLVGFTLADDSVSLNLAVPGGAVLRRLACGREQRLEGEGILVGYVSDARGEAALKGAVVRARWLELALEQKNYRSVIRNVTAIVDDEGRYRACGITSEDAVSVEISKPGYRAITDRMTVPRNGAVRQNFRLVSAATSRGTSSLAGRASHVDGSPLVTGRASIPALSLDAPIRDGEFQFAGLPSGTWLVETTGVGLEPQSVLVDVVEGVVATPAITMADRAQLLDAVSVLGKPGGSDKILDGINARRKYAHGTVFLPGNDWLAIARDPADLVRDAAGFQYVSPEKVLASGCGFRDLPTERTGTFAAYQKPRDRVLAIYLNGLRVVGGLQELRTAVSMRDVLAVEAYQDVQTAPAEWRTYDACAVMAVWTKR